MNIQSISDIITNSSSEIFCRIKSKDFTAIFDLLYGIIGGGDSEYKPTIEFDNDNPTEITVYMPYQYSEQTVFYEAGIIAILDKYFKDLYTIEFK